MLSGDMQLMLPLTPTGSLKLAKPAATNLIGPLERQTDGSPHLLPGFTSKHFGVFIERMCGRKRRIFGRF